MLASSRTIFRSSTSVLHVRCYSSASPLFGTERSSIQIEGVTYPSDDYTNASPTILSKLPYGLHKQPDHPLGIIRNLIESHFDKFTPVIPPSAIVSVRQNFDELGFADDHPGRAKSDSYYLNKDTVLRTHTSAHEIETFKRGLEKWLLSADVYRRDEIDSSHYPVFHQMEGASVWGPKALKDLPKENQALRDLIASNPSPLLLDDPTQPLDAVINPSQPEHDEETLQLLVDNLKLSLNSMILALFRSHTDQAGEPLQIRWINATFPWTAPSYEVEVMFEGKWLEILGCGVVKQDALVRSDVPEKVGWAFGLGLERLAMILFNIPDIRLFWTQDPRFAAQFASSRGITQFSPWSRYPSCNRDLSFWLPDESTSTEERLHENDVCDIFRDIAGDMVESVEKFDEFVHPKTGRRSLSYRVVYRSMERTLTNTEVSELHSKVNDALIAKFGITIR
ncbi:phenylalanyl-trna synthetase [Phaffia rhodozyma]|uniref:Phenylalanine--tRNA ligase, mitochondrial n=1 Tax=Phaffia rhodozyma TaxID=264483 RepID=A0A0F7STD7_PHARH|nr:phenylalanyl-trna synthetase [Phaffia rhodozyma]